MRRLMLLRHGKSERNANTGRDLDRKLSKRGRADVPMVGAYMARHGLGADLALVSPATRAVETFALVAPFLAKAPRVASESRIYDADVDDLIAVLGEQQRVPSLLLVGHNPGMQDLAGHLIGTGAAEAVEDMNDKLPTSALVVIDFTDDDWQHLHHAGRLELFVSPRLLKD